MAQTVTRLFPDGDYPQRLAGLWAAVDAAEKANQAESSAPRVLGEPDPYVELAEEYAALKAEAEADARAKRRAVTLHAVGRGAFRDLRAKHPPRLKSETVDEETAKADRLAGVNVDTVEDDLLYASVTEPTFTSRADFDEWADSLSEGEFKTLVQLAWELSNTARFDPKSLPASRPPRSDAN